MKRVIFAVVLMACVCVVTRADQHCDSYDKWNASQVPFALFGNSYYVGVRGLSSVLIATPSGHILIDGGLPKSAPKIATSIERLGFRIQDVKYILSSHAHIDHMGGH